MVERGLGNSDIVALVISKALNAATENDDPLQVHGLIELQRAYYSLNLKPTPVDAIAGSLRAALGLAPTSHGATPETPKLDYAAVLRMSFYSPNGQIQLTPTEHRILSFLYVNQGLVMSSDDIGRGVFAEADDTNGGSLYDSIKVHVARLRKKVNNPKTGFHPIEGVWGRGYLFLDPKGIIEVKAVSDDSPKVTD